MDINAITPTQAIQAILAPAVMISSSALFFLGLSNRYIALLTRIRILNEEKRQLNRKFRKIGELEQVENAGERLRNLYNRVYGLLLQVAESQPVANRATLELLYRSIELAEVTADAVEATAQETKRNWNLP